MENTRKKLTELKVGEIIYYQDADPDFASPYFTSRNVVLRIDEIGRSGEAWAYNVKEEHKAEQWQRHQKICIGGLNGVEKGGSFAFFEATEDDKKNCIN